MNHVGRNVVPTSGHPIGDPAHRKFGISKP